MSPGKVNGPAADRPATNNTLAHDDDTASVNRLCDISPRDALVAQIYALGKDALLPASLGWRLGRLDAEEAAKQRLGQAGADVASSPEWQAVRRRPRWVELQQRRGECAQRHRLEHCTCGGAE